MSFNKKDKKYYGYLYIITNEINNKIYIGQTRRTIRIRWREHLSSIDDPEDENIILYRAMKKYGSDKFTIKLLKEYSFASKNDLINCLNDEEIKYISEYNSLNPNGYNMQAGGKSPTESLKRPVDKYDTNGTFICSYNSISEALEDNSIFSNHSHISECCKGSLYTAYGYVWRYKGESFDKYSYKKDKRTRRVNVYTKNGLFIKMYDTIKDAMLDLLGFYDSNKSSHVSSCCKGFRNSAYGYVWKYSN